MQFRISLNDLDHIRGVMAIDKKKVNVTIKIKKFKTSKRESRKNLLLKLS